MNNLGIGRFFLENYQVVFTWTQTADADADAH